MSTESPSSHLTEAPVVTGLSVTWEGEKRLLIEYPCETECIGTKLWQWHDVRISYRCLAP